MMDLSLFEKLDNAIASAKLARKCPAPLTLEDKREIRARVDRVLRIRQEWVPEISMRTLRTRECAKFTIETVRFRSWEGIYGDASLYLPRDLSKPVPVLLFCHGHAMDTGRFARHYQEICQMLAEHGVAAFINDQFGAGGRALQGHRDSFEVFGCGTTVCGMMVLESMGLFRALRRDPRFDPERAGFMGHSGGGQNSVFLCAELFEEAAVGVPTGFACSYEYTARKERHLCECDLFPGILHEFEMWHLLACMNHRKMLAASGLEDPMIARDVVVRLAHRVAACDPVGNCEVWLWDGNHSLSSPGVYNYLVDFVLRAFGLPETGGAFGTTAVFPAAPELNPEPFPADCGTMTDVAERLTGKQRGGETCLADVFPRPDFLTETEFASLPDGLKTLFIQGALFL